jgi:hypothetical protein
VSACNVPAHDLRPVHEPVIKARANGERIEKQEGMNQTRGSSEKWLARDGVASIMKVRTDMRLINSQGIAHTTRATPPRLLVRHHWVLTCKHDEGELMAGRTARYQSGALVKK